MKHAMTIIIIIIALLSIAAGTAKVMRVPEEAEFLRQFGFTDTLMILFGGLQIIAGVLLAVPAVRLYGAMLAAAGFAVSCGLLFMSGDALFGSVSLIPFALASMVAYQCMRAE